MPPAGWRMHLHLWQRLGEEVPLADTCLSVTGFNEAVTVAVELRRFSFSRNFPTWEI